MKCPEAGWRRLVVKVKPGTGLRRKRTPRRFFLGVRFKDRLPAMCPVRKVEADQ